MTELIEFKQEDGIATITLSRPEKLNALTPEMYARIGEILDEVKENKSVRVLILQGKGRAFSAGFDITLEVGERDPYEHWDFIDSVANANRWKIWNLDQPVIAKIHGYCLAGALELVLPSDFIIAAEHTELGSPMVQFGAAPVFMIVPWLVGLMKAKELLFLGNRISATEAERIGLISRVVADDQLDSTVAAVAQQIVKLPEPSVRWIKKGINRSYEARGMKSAIDNWLDSAVLVSCFKSEESKVFQDLVNSQGLQAALRWREERFRSK